MEKKAIITVLMVVSMTVVPSSGQIGSCWRRITDCISLVDAENLDQCCPDIRFELRTERVCFCAIEPTLTRNATLKGAVNTILSFCDLSSFDLLCPDAGTPPLSSHSTPRRSTSSDEDTFRPPPGTTFAPPPRYTDDPADSNPYPSSPNPSNGKNLKVIIPAVIVPIVVVIGAVVVLGFCFLKRQRNKHTPTPSPPPPPPPPPPPAPLQVNAMTTDSSSIAPKIHRDFASAESLQYEMASLQAATNNFSSKNQIGWGRFGAVYKGILANGKEIAVRRLSATFFYFIEGEFSATSKEGDEEFKNEVLLLAKLQHKNLVSLIGFCLANTEKLLIYEFVPNSSLDHFLFGDATKKRELYWSRRYSIIRGIAKGLLYLHEDSPTTIIHRDLKATNILLDREMNPKIADFGLARVCSFEQTHVEKGLVAGTILYTAPEYMIHGNFSTKSDVYSFGVLILEIISGKRVDEFFQSPAGTLNLLNFAWTCWLDGKPLALVDSTLMGGSYPNNDVINIVNLGLLCVQEDISRRPDMAQIVHILKTQSVAAETLSMPQPPSFMADSVSNQTTTTINTSSTIGSQNY